MATALNPFIWDRPLDDPAKIVGMDAFANRVALTLKGQPDVEIASVPADTTHGFAASLKDKKFVTITA